jgi:serine/threonine protein kinase
MPYPVSAIQLLGQTIDGGALRIEAILGAGAFGVVYRAVDTRSGAHYAVKRVEKDCSDYRQSREASLHARVSSHPNVLTFHREIDAGSHAFFVYDLCAGDLHSVIKKLTFFREDELIKSVFIQIIDALDFCHSRGVYHRDLKPENILVSSLTGDIGVFVADFGLATTSEMTASSCGTPCYMSPGMHLVLLCHIITVANMLAESLVPHHHAYSTVEGDIWALGCILAEMIANVRPWMWASPEDRVYNDYLLDRSILLDVLPVSDDAYSLLKKILSPRPECRPSLDEIRNEVLEMDTFFLTDREVAICGWTTRFEKKMRRKLAKCSFPSVSSRRSEDTSASSESYYPTTSASSSGSRYSSGSSSSAFESISLESSAAPLTPPTPAVEAFHSMDKAVGLALPAAAFC